MSAATRKVLLTGATGFIGSHLYPALVAAGYDVVCATRDPERAAARDPDRRWVALDVDDPTSMPRAMAGCDAAFYLIHGMSQGRDYPERERRSAEAFAKAAAEARLGRLVYLGGVVPPEGKVSKHLRSRERTGRILRAGRVPTIELRAAMVMGAGSVSWTMVRDLAARLPAMVLPRWLRNVSYPILVDDVVTGLLEALMLPATGSAYYELPGPERVTHREILDRTARAMCRRSVKVNVPILTPRLSSYWIALVTRVDLDMAKELVEGLRRDLVPSGTSLWDEIGRVPTPLGRAIELALADEDADELPSPATRARLISIGRSHAARMGRAVA